MLLAELDDGISPDDGTWVRGHTPWVVGRVAAGLNVLRSGRHKWIRHNGLTRE